MALRDFTLQNFMLWTVAATVCASASAMVALPHLTAPPAPTPVLAAPAMPAPPILAETTPLPPIPLPTLQHTPKPERVALITPPRHPRLPLAHPKPIPRVRAVPRPVAPAPDPQRPSWRADAWPPAYTPSLRYYTYAPRPRAYGYYPVY